ncbi:early-responsive to dehydration stress protein (ERD4) isoform X2 [Tasmannia lanceolata]|uniref:early-responsive to dehydration stress protein (ERD4) isoform X2 n=1 Tax=Tasmannia lanceolata TaxID=3420 RepID=UPI0040627E7A
MRGWILLMTKELNENFFVLVFGFNVTQWKWVVMFVCGASWGGCKICALLLFPQGEANFSSWFQVLHILVFLFFLYFIKFFLICSVVGLVILLPVNYTCEKGPSRSKLSHSMDSFTISNIGKGSNRLWVHFSCLCFISFYGLYLLYKECNEIMDIRIQHLYNIRHRPDRFTILVREIPFCPEHQTRGCCVDHFFSKHHPYSYQSYQILYDGKHVEALLHQASSISRKIKHLRQRSMTNKCSRASGFLNIFRENVSQIGILEERFQVLCHKLRHLQCENMLRQKELPVAFVSFKSRWGAAIASQTRQHVNPILWITEPAPEPRDVLWNNLAIPYSHLIFHKIGVFIAAAVLTIFFALPVTTVQGIVQLEKIKKWFPPARAVQLIPGLSSVLTGYLPSVILNSFIYVIPYAMRSMATLEGCVSRSKKEMKACSMVFYFLVGNVFFLSLLSGSLLDQIGESFTHPRSFPSHLASAVSAQADFFITYILTDGLSGFSLEVLQPGLLIWHCMKSHSCCGGTKRKPYLYSLPYYRVIPIVSLSILIGMVYAVIAPLLLPFLIVYFFLGYVVYLNQIQDVYDIVYETCGQYWPYIHHYIFIAIVLMQITMIGLFGLKSKPAASISTVLLLLTTLLFNEYCKMRFLPTFFYYSIQNAMEADESDEREGLMEANRENVINAYRPPCLRPMNFTSPKPSSMQPLVSST